jgi:hypothetical protein
VIRRPALAVLLAFLVIACEAERAPDAQSRESGRARHGQAGRPGFPASAAPR